MFLVSAHISSAWFGVVSGVESLPIPSSRNFQRIYVPRLTCFAADSDDELIRALNVGIMGCTYAQQLQACQHPRLLSHTALPSCAAFASLVRHSNLSIVGTADCATGRSFINGPVIRRPAVQRALSED